MITQDLGLRSAAAAAAAAAGDGGVVVRWSGGDDDDDGATEVLVSCFPGLGHSQGRIKERSTRRTTMRGLRRWLWWCWAAAAGLLLLLLLRAD